MNRNRVLIPAAIVLIMLAAWYKLIDNNHGMTEQYNTYVTQARSLGANGAVQRAVDQYNEALKIKSSPELYEEVAQLYKRWDKLKKYRAWCEDFVDAFPALGKAYECLLDACEGAKDYETCFDTLEITEKRGITTPFIDETRERLHYIYHIEYKTYEDVGIFSNNLCAVRGKEGWGFVNRYGEVRVAARYQSVGAFTTSGVASVVDRNAETYYIDKTGTRDVGPDAKYVELGSIVNDRAPARREDGTYVYLNTQSNFEPMDGVYLEASSYNYGIAAVRTEDGWHFIDVDGKNAIQGTFSDVIMDEKRIVARNDRIFAAVSDGAYVMMDMNGNQIGQNRFEDARLFTGEEPTAVKIGGKWRFIDGDGNFLSEKTYENARAFSNGLAAVCQNGKWSFVDQNETVCIEGAFLDARDFNAKGSCFIKLGDSWQLLKLYRLNRE